MNRGYYDTEELIVALATPWGESALAVIRTAGSGALEAFSACFSKPEVIRGGRSGTLHYGHIIDGSTGIPVDEVTVAIFRAPSGYTGQDSAEIFCHGSLPGIHRIMEVLHRAGFRDAEPGEFTLRAFVQGKLDLTRAEAVQEIVSAKTIKAHSLALGRLSGNLFREIDAIKGELVRLLATVEVQLDYAEDEIEEPVEIPVSEVSALKERIHRLAATYSAGKMYAEGVRIVLAGRTNSGKSSLFNLFLKEDRSIVSDIHGTTRDYIESWIAIRGIPVKLFDTAGFRSAADSIEEEGIRRSGRIVDSADIILYLVDGTIGVTEEARLDLDALRGEAPLITVWSKADIARDVPPAETVTVSAVTGEGFENLEEAIVSVLPGMRLSQDAEIMIDSLRQKELLDQAEHYLEQAVENIMGGMPLDVTAPEISGAVDSLGELTGEVTSADILDTIFSGFCVGK